VAYDRCTYDRCTYDRCTCDRCTWNWHLADDASLT
jgi:hypothetical protein